MFPIKDSIRIPHPPVMVYLVILVNLVVFLYQSTLTDRAAIQFSHTYGLVPARYFNSDHPLSLSEYWPFITGTFMHGNWWHIILNMWILYIFGSSLEGRIGRLPFLSFYLVCGVIASLAHAYFNRDSAVPAVGASGAIAGVMGAYATTFPRARVTILILIVIFPFFFRIPALGFALIWFALQFIQGFMELASSSIEGGIAWWAHIGGFIAGVLLIPLLRFGPDLTVDESAVAWKAPWPFSRSSGDSGRNRRLDTPWRRGPWD